EIYILSSRHPLQKIRFEKDAKNQFRKLSYNRYQWMEFEIDYDSVMMYGSYAFSKNNGITIERKDGGTIRRNDILSRMDKAKLWNLRNQRPEPDEIGNGIKRSCRLARQINLEVDSDDVQELPDSHNQELTMDELIDIHEQRARY
ncbi:metalloendopeptidase, partial [Trichonephila clavipes]